MLTKEQHIEFLISTPVHYSPLRCFDVFLKLLATWLDRVANSFINDQTSAFVEGLNK